MSINNEDPIVYPADDEEAYDPVKQGYPHPDNHKPMPGDLSVIRYSFDFNKPQLKTPNHFATTFVYDPGNLKNQ